MAVNDACNIFNSSISDALHSATAHTTSELFVNQSYATSRCFSLICLESEISGISSKSYFVKITAPATTGPHKGPRPASSTPAIIFLPQFFSIEKSGTLRIISKRWFIKSIIHNNEIFRRNN